MQADQKLSSEVEVGAIAFSVDGATLTGVCRDGKVRMWDVRSGALKKTVPLEKSESAMALHSSSDWLATGSANGVKVWDLQNGQVARWVASPPQRVRSFIVSEDRKLMAGSGKTFSDGSEDTVRVWDASGKERFAVRNGIGGTATMAFSPDGSLLAASSYDADVRAWRTKDGELVRLIDELPVSMFAMQFSPDGKYLATAGVDRVVYLWETTNWKLTRKLSGHEDMISSLDFSNDGRMLATGGFSEVSNRSPVKVILWDLGSGKSIRTVTAPMRVGSVAFAPDGKLLATSSNEKNVNLWSVPGR
jgi:WD40 repeat protein